MGIEVEWYQGRQDIIRYIYNGQWTWDDLWKAFDKGREMMESVSPKTVHLFIDMSKSSMLPQRPWDQGQKLNSMAPKNEGVRVVIGANTFVRMAQETLLKVYQVGGRAIESHKARMVATLQEAEKVIADYRPSTV
jgi:hypothetical protein